VGWSPRRLWTAPGARRPGPGRCSQPPTGAPSAPEAGLHAKSVEQCLPRVAVEVLRPSAPGRHPASAHERHGLRLGFRESDERDRLPRPSQDSLDCVPARGRGPRRSRQIQLRSNGSQLNGACPIPHPHSTHETRFQRTGFMGFGSCHTAVRSGKTTAREEQAATGHWVDDH